jgi:hypothetical protein
MGILSGKASLRQGLTDDVDIMLSIKPVKPEGFISGCQGAKDNPLKCRVV